VVTIMHGAWYAWWPAKRQELLVNGCRRHLNWSGGTHCIQAGEGRCKYIESRVLEVSQEYHEPIVTMVPQAMILPH
jgi:hypothetical protein